MGADVKSNGLISEGTATARQLRDTMTGTNISLDHIPVPELIAVTDPDLRRQFASLKNEQQRQGFLDALLRRLDASILSWTTFYEAVAILREHQSYWHKKGFSSFADFWRARAAPTFEAWKELEDVYAFAKLACPDLFELDPTHARRLAQRLNALSAPTRRQRRRARGGKRVFETPAEATDAIRHALTWEMVSNRSFEYRIYRLKRDHPGIVALLLAGDYTVRLDNGTYAVDLIKAERRLYGEGYGHRSEVAKRKNRSGSLSQTKKAGRVLLDIERLARAAGSSHKLQQQIIGRMRKFPWLVQALSAPATRSRR
jgi:hypothetical protein